MDSATNTVCSNEYLPTQEESETHLPEPVEEEEEEEEKVEVEGVYLLKLQELAEMRAKQKRSERDDDNMSHPGVSQCTPSQLSTSRTPRLPSSVLPLPHHSSHQCPMGQQGMTQMQMGMTKIVEIQHHHQQRVCEATYMPPPLVPHCPRRWR